MLPFLRTGLMAVPLLALTACQMETPQASSEEVAARRLALSAAVLEDCRATMCDRLNLDSQYVPDFSVVADMTHVTAFMASYTDFDDLADIAPMTQLRELHIGQTQITDLSGLRNFPNLTLLHLQGGEDQDLNPIAGLAQLEELALGYKTIDDFSFLGGLRRLTSLNLDSATITDMNGLRNHPSIETLDLIKATLPDDISLLTTLPNLREVSVSDWKLDDAQKAVIAQLEAKGVSILISDPVVIVC